MKFEILLKSKEKELQLKGKKEFKEILKELNGKLEDLNG